MAVKAQPPQPSDSGKAKRIATKVLITLFGGSVTWTVVWIVIGIVLYSDHPMGGVIAFYWWIAPMLFVVPLMLVLLIALPVRPDAWE